jgi:hypothetical protein
MTSSTGWTSAKVSTIPGPEGDTEEGDSPPSLAPQ